MDLLQTVRKEGSRGGVNFSWDDVKSDAQRENYLGHSLMAPVGRWQKGKDLNWYAKADDAELTAEETAAKEREAKKEELRKVKEAEEDAMARALGLPVPDRSANTELLGMNKVQQREVNQALEEALGDGDEAVDIKSGLRGRKIGSDREGDRRAHSDPRLLGEHRRDRSRDRRRGHDEDREKRSKRHRRSRSRSGDRERSHRHRNHNPSRSRSRDRPRLQSRSRDERREDTGHWRRRDHENRSRSRDRDRRRYRSRSRLRSPHTRKRRSYDR